ncbi:sulfurtransferase [Agrobacterium rhizogenes]|uniref:Rhodanese domain-containing protein n=4 Tax=Agrobacterium TaxID=357 RepID=A0A5B9T1M0_AGRTU|nr:MULTISPECIES: sulfurtransferase/chromate resistance protein [Rhizobium/Agrobacterium group]KJF70703.1 sulfurtransferase [Agrobacterium arsenijevicii]NTF66207.1 sulfurtransferase [Rhizobium rhizogenes]NTF98168.1 sulfurtransferase [Rhizobium rhizogenes]NTG12056.1 sulfurtransferase [Rhizobium rhizogenes]NTG95813.1 sulfurtransferase [Rhizobium rhizogenes]
MPSFLEITADKLARIIGTPNPPTIIDVRIDEDFTADPRFIPGSVRRDFRRVTEWGPDISGPSIVLCQKGQKLGHGVAAHLRVLGKQAEVLEGGFEAWREARGMLVPEDKLPRRDAQGRTVWVTRSRPKIDRIACPWLIRRFIDPSAIFLFVPASEVSLVADRFGATPFDIEDVFWSHRGDLCTFDVMIEEFGLDSVPLQRLATIVRGADTGRPELAPEVAGLLAASLGLSRMFNDDLEQLEAGLTLYDAFYRWCRDATGETHNWPNAKAGQ